MVLTDGPIKLVVMVYSGLLSAFRLVSQFLKIKKLESHLLFSLVNDSSPMVQGLLPLELPISKSSSENALAHLASLTKEIGMIALAKQIEENEQSRRERS